MKNTEKMLKRLFDYQVFSQNRHLDRVIRNTQVLESRELGDGVLFAVVGGNQQGMDNKDCPERLLKMKSTCIHCIHCKKSPLKDNIYHCDVLDMDYAAKDEQNINNPIK